MKYFGNGGFSVLEKSMEYSLFSGGKRIRPVIMLATCEMFSKGYEKAMPYAAALEMIHTYSLIHDDLPSMDNDDFRRGKPTNHKVFGEANGILAGDGLLNLAFETAINNIVDEKTLKSAKELSKNSGRLGMISGQSADLYFEKKQATYEDLIYIEENKTGALLRSSFVIGGILGGANAEEIDKMHALGNAYGVIFQLTDDLLDIYGSEKAVGKTLGKDNAQMKPSAVNVLGEKKARELLEEKRSYCIKVLSSLNLDSSFLENLINFTISREF